MKFHFQQALRALVLLLFCLLIFKLHYTGEITKFINPKYVNLSQIASVIFLILFFIQTTRIWSVNKDVHDHCGEDSCSHDHGNTIFTFKKLVSYSIIIFPIATGFVLPPKTLGADIVGKKGGMAVITNQQQVNQDSEQVEIDLDEIEIQDDYLDHSFDDSAILNENIISKEEYNVLIQKLEQSQTVEMDEQVFFDYYEEMHKNIDKYKGRTIKLKGFVYKEEGFSSDQLVISRFAITHCIADASIVGYLSEFSEASSLDQDSWIEAEGTIEMTTYQGMELPMLKITNWSTIEEPDEPYIYPLNIKII
ncbi:TIGR03943 family putative permease subunit [Bacillus sp. PS06]|uniref:TIGR03943 family putative permease subunit n=1 Tax=Bacillus sp. PS06 TaxID=2764176 RepID=UPI0017825E79|nr:TIGR03943 family protein [Bacillus sp. PS06]MBD8067668.1 TIGR03943 family protein [Bacillus sp. PS06]